MMIGEINLFSFGVSDRAPPCHAMRRDKSFYSFEAQAGRPAIVILAGSLPPAATTGIAASFHEKTDILSALDTDVILIVDGECGVALDYEAAPIVGADVVYCLKDFFARCGFASQRPGLFVIDRNQRVLDLFDPTENSDYIARALACIAKLPREKQRYIALPAPVLSVPNILSPAVCRKLIDHFDNGETLPGGMASVDNSGKAIHKVDLAKKHRRDCLLNPGEPLHDSVVQALVQSCLPEMKKAFQFEAGYTDRILIARYDDAGGYFKRHRDNVAVSVAHRQFAISINLNADEYEGGYLTFPEYNDHTYRPCTGAGIIFSASLLHEAMPVTKGCRYVLLTFFHNAAAQALRVSNAEQAAADEAQAA